MTKERKAKPGGGERIYNILVPDSIFGLSLTPEEMDKKLTLRLGPGSISALFQILGDKLKKILQGGGSEDPQVRNAILLASVKTVWEALEATSRNKLPVRGDILEAYKSLTSALFERDFSGAMGTLLGLQRQEFDPYTRRLSGREGYTVVEVPIYVDQLDLISSVLLSNFRDVLSRGWGEKDNQYMPTVGLLYRILVDLRTDKLGLPVRANFIRWIETAYNFTGFEEQRI